MRPNFKATILVFMLMLFSSINASVAGSLPAYYTNNYQHSGIVDRIDTKNKMIVINDTLLFFDVSTKIHSPVTEFSSIEMVKTGQRVGCNYQLSDKGKQIITELWILPKGAPTLPPPN